MIAEPPPRAGGDRHLPRADRAARLRVGEPVEGRRDRRPRRRRDRAAAATGRRPRRRRGRRHPGRQRSTEGGGDRRRDRACPASPTTPDSRSPPSAGCPGVDTATLRRTGCVRRGQLVEAARRPRTSEADRRARFRTIAMVVWPDGSRAVRRGHVRRRDRRDAPGARRIRLRQRVRAGGGRRPHVRRDDPRREAGDQPSRQGVRRRSSSGSPEPSGRRVGR